MRSTMKPGMSKSSLHELREVVAAGQYAIDSHELAGDMLERDKVDNGFIVLVSDLETAPEDVEAMSRTVQDLQRKSVDMRVVPISASSDGLRLYQGLLGPKAFASLPGGGGEERRFENAVGSGLPTGLLVLGALLFALLALHERFSGRLALPRERGEAA